MGSVCNTGIDISHLRHEGEETLQPNKVLDEPKLQSANFPSQSESDDCTESGSESKIIIRGHEILETLGKGTFGTVKKARNQKTGAIFALKFISKNENFDKKAIVKEIQSMQRVRSPYVISLYAYSMDVQYISSNGEMKDSALLVMEYAPGGDFFELLYYSHKMDEKLGRTYFHQLCEGLSAIHAAGVIHRDLKPQNILVDHKFCLKITDFGHSTIVDHPYAILQGSHFGTKGFQAPEIVLGRSYTRSCDVFALGVILFNMMTHSMPFKVASVKDSFYYLIARNTEADWKTFWKVNNNPGSPELRNLIQNLLCYQPRYRITLNQAMEHPWYTKETHPDNSLKELVWRTHRLAHEAKLKDPDRAKRLESGPAPQAVYRAISRIECEVETVSTLDPFATHYELHEQTSADELMTNVRKYMSTTLFAKFKKCGNNSCSGSYKARTRGKGTAKLNFEFGVIRRFHKLLFYLKIKKSEWFELTEQCENTILDALRSMDCVKCFYAEQRKMQNSPKFENYNFFELERDSF